MAENVSVADVLERAADLIEPEGAWTRFCLARDAEGNSVLVGSDKAVCFCMEGAIRRVSGWSDEHPAVDLLERVTETIGYGDWNDSHIQIEVVAALREAAALSRTQDNTDGR